MKVREKVCVGEKEGGKGKKGKREGVREREGE